MFRTLRCSKTMFGLVAAMLLAAGCGPGARATPAEGTASPAPQATPDASQLLRKSIAAMQATKGYKFDVQAIHRFTFEGNQQTLRYQGSGTMEASGDFQWELHGQVDIFFKAARAAGKTQCWDTRGPIEPCTETWGGLRAGTSPYLVIRYLHYSRPAGSVSRVALGGQDNYRIPFTPALEQVSALGSAYAKALEGVRSVRGEVWVEPTTTLPHQIQVEVEFNSKGREGQMQETLVFSNYRN